MIQRISVALVQNLAQPLTYQTQHPEPIIPGQRVLVPLGRTTAVAWVVSDECRYSGRLRSVLALFDDPFRFDPAFLRSIAVISRTYLQSQGQLLEAALPQDLKAAKGYEMEKEGDPGSLKLPICRSVGVSRFPLLHSQTINSFVPQYTGSLQITGPNRFDELLALAEGILSRGGSLLTLAGDAQTIDAMATSLPGLRAYHSKTPIPERRRIWQATQMGEPQWIIGGVSAALLPIRGLSAFLIIDAENPAHFSRFFRDYGAAHLARLRAGAEGIPLICSSPSPTLLSSWFSPHAEILHHDVPQALKPVMVKPARWARPEAMERLRHVLQEEYDPGKRCLYVTATSAAAQSAWCSKCKRRQSGDNLQNCPSCSEPLLHFPRPSALWLRDVLGQRSETGLITLLKKDITLSSENSTVVGQAAMLAWAGNGYDRVILLGPESWISLDEVDGALRLWALLEEARERLNEGGEIIVYSTFHFHYALRLANDSSAFFEREMNYRRWFGLPPLSAVYQLDFRHKELRTLAGLMRRWNDCFKGMNGVRIDQQRLQSRIPFRGVYKGSLVFHGQAEQIWASGLFPDRSTSARLIMA